MIRDTIRATRTVWREAGKVTKAASEMVGVEKAVDGFQKGVEAIPLVKGAVSLVAAVSQKVAPDKEPLYKQEAGPHDVATHKQEFVDPARGRKIPMTVYYPSGGEQLEGQSSPVVVFSHGMAGNSQTYRYLGRHWASHGYTVIQPTHVGSDTKAVLTRGPLAFNKKELVNRTEDVSFALDMLELGQLPEEVTRGADLGHVAVAGHSFGGLTAQVMAGVSVKDGEERLQLGDERADAFVAISGYGDSAPSHMLGLDVSTFNQIDQPILFVAGEKDTLFTLGKGAGVHTEQVEATGTDETGAVVVGGTRHHDFGQVFGYGNRKAADLTRSSTLAFLDAQLKNDEEARSYLADDLPRVAASWDSEASYGRSR